MALRFALAVTSVFILFIATGATVQRTAHQDELVNLWRFHCSYEFDPEQKGVEKTMATMVGECRQTNLVNHKNLTPT